MTKKYWHVSNGKLFTGGTDDDGLKAYVSRLRKAYDSLRGVRVYEAITDDADPDLLVYDIPGRIHPDTKNKIEKQWRRVKLFSNF